MCSPEVSRIVNERLAREGVQVSRRGFLKMGGALAALASLGAINSGMARAAAPADMHGGGGWRVVDLSHTLSPDFPVYPAFEPAQVRALFTVEQDGFYTQQWTFGEHTSTHMDFPGHFVAGGGLVDNMDVGLLVGAAVVIDISARAEQDPNATLLVEDILAWEAENGMIPDGAFVLVYSGWEARLAEEGAFANMDENGVMNFPGISVEAAQFLASERNLHGVGIDTLSLDIGPSTTFDAHFFILGAGLLGIENVANLASIIGEKATIVCGIPKYQNGSGGPVRVLALVENQA